MIDEFAARKPNFDEANSVKVAFADGVEMWLPKPWYELRPSFSNGKATANYPVFTYGPAIDALLDAIGECELLSEQMVAVASLAAYLLQWHYELDDADLDSLLCYRVGDDQSRAWFDRTMEVATGRSGPKVRRAGGN
jgi:hypothetical protein